MLWERCGNVVGIMQLPIRTRVTGAYGVIVTTAEQLPPSEPLALNAARRRRDRRTVATSTCDPGTRESVTYIQYSVKGPATLLRIGENVHYKPDGT